MNKRNIKICIGIGVAIALPILFTSSSILPGIKDRFKKGWQTIKKAPNQVVKVPKKIKETLVTIKDKLPSPTGSIKDMLARPDKSQTSLRRGSGILQNELSIIKERKNRAEKVVEQVFNQGLPSNVIPSTGIVASGGGFRAMISTLGMMQGLQELGLLNLIEYFSTLSGSTWFLSSWLAHGSSLDQLSEYLKKQAKIGPAKNIISPRGMEFMARQLLRKKLYHQKVTLADLYGVMLGAMLLKGLSQEGQRVYPEELQDRVNTGRYPFPIFTSVINKTRPYVWLEYTPFEVGSDEYNLWVQTKSFGKKFMNGEQAELAPRARLSFLMAIFGSAYAVNMQEAIEHVGKGLAQSITNWARKIPGGKTIARALLQDLESLLMKKAEMRLSPPAVHNFMHGVRGTQFTNDSHLKVFDAGIAFNLPFPPLMRRNTNFYIVCDASAISNATHHPLRKVERYAQRRGYKFPHIDYGEILENKVSIFYDPEDPEVPVIVYFPNQEPITTFKFKYSNDQFERVRSYMKDAVVESKDSIIKGLYLAIMNQIKLQKKARFQALP
jgi:phospholipase A2